MRCKCCAKKLKTTKLPNGWFMCKRCKKNCPKLSTCKLPEEDKPKFTSFKFGDKVYFKRPWMKHWIVGLVVRPHVKVQRAYALNEPAEKMMHVSVDTYDIYSLKYSIVSDVEGKYMRKYVC